MACKTGRHATNLQIPQLLHKLPLFTVDGLGDLDLKEGSRGGKRTDIFTRNFKHVHRSQDHFTGHNRQACRQGEKAAGRSKMCPACLDVHKVVAACIGGAAQLGHAALGHDQRRAWLSACTQDRPSGNMGESRYM